MEKPQSFERVRVAGKEVELTRENTSLFNHLGRAALFDHVYIATEVGAYQWRYDPQTGRDSEQYEYLKNKVVENQCPLFLNISEPHEKDVLTYMAHAQPDWDNLEIEDE